MVNMRICQICISPSYKMDRQIIRIIHHKAVELIDPAGKDIGVNTINPIDRRIDFNMHFLIEDVGFCSGKISIAGLGKCGEREAEEEDYFLHSQKVTKKSK